MAAPEIIKRERVTTASVSEDNYQNTIIKTTEGATIKLSPKRQNLKNEFEPECATDIGWAVYMDKEYVATAKLVRKSKNPSVDAPQSKSTPLPEQTRPITPSIDREHDIHRQVALKIASALAEAKLIPLEAIPFRTEYYNKLLDGTIKYSEEGVDLIQKMDMAYALEALAKYNKKTEVK